MRRGMGLAARNVMRTNIPRYIRPGSDWRVPKWATEHDRAGLQPPVHAALPLTSLSPPSGWFFGAGLAAVVLLLLTVSGLALTELGWNYGEAGGSALEKMHPGTLIAAVVLLLSAGARGNPLSAFIRTFEAHPGLIIYFAGIIVLMLHSVFVAGLPFTVFIDTFVLPAILFLLLQDIPEERRRNLALLVHALFAINAVLGLAEFAFGFRLTPLYVEGEVLEAEWRSSALLGHPLGNAILTGCYMIMLVKSGARDLPLLLRPVVFALATAGMVVFGGRAATAFMLVVLGGLALKRGTEVLRGAPFDKRVLLAALVCVPFIAMAVIVLQQSGFFDQFVNRIVDDEGSASTRVEMFELFKYLNWYDFLLGPDPRQIATLMAQYGLLYGIESFWVAMTLLHGVVVSFVFFAALFFFCREVVMSAGSGAFVVFLYFFAVASTSVSLSAKSPVFAIMVMLTFLLGDGSARTRPAG
jgi:hypothetical protein